MTSKEEAFSFLAPLQNCEKWRLATSCLSVYLLVRPSGWNNSVLTGRIFKKFDIWVFFENLSRKCKSHSNPTKIKGTIHEDQCTFMIVRPLIILIMRNISEKMLQINSKHTLYGQCLFFQKTCRLWDTVYSRIQSAPFLQFQRAKKSDAD